MPGWYIHMDAARKAVDGLAANPGAQSIFTSSGYSPSAIAAIAHANPAYVALGAIGPDIFFLLPDFQGTGSMLTGAAQVMEELFTWWDLNFVEPYEQQVQPFLAQTTGVVGQNAADQMAALTGDMSTTIADITTRAIGFLKEFAIVMMVRQYDVFGIFGSGVPLGYDEKTFYWSDMLHYRRTYHFPARMWQMAQQSPSPWKERLQAFAVGWMSHCATDVTGHAFVNEKCGGPYRLHWQRHHLVENHMDSMVCVQEHTSSLKYRMFSSSAVHLWIAFKDDGSSYADCFTNFQTQPSLNYFDPSVDDPANPNGLPDAWDVWDVDSDMPAPLAEFIVKALKDVYATAEPNPNIPDVKGQCAPHPTILSDFFGQTTGGDGFPTAEDIKTTYWVLYKYLKGSATSSRSFPHPPPPPERVYEQPEPTAPYTGDLDPDIDWSDLDPDDISLNSAWHFLHKSLKALIEILAYLVYIEQELLYPLTNEIGVILSQLDYPVRQWLYDHAELPLYNAWLSMHWYLAMTGFVKPNPDEINLGLTTLGVGVAHHGTVLRDALNALEGGLIASQWSGASEPSGRDQDLSLHRLPRDVVLDAPLSPGEYLRPWSWPEVDNHGNPVPSEQPLSPASPFNSGQDASILLGPAPGDNSVRDKLARAQNAGETISIAISATGGNFNATDFASRRHLGDSVDYSCYVIAQLTRDDVISQLTRTAPLEQIKVANFNLDADRGYAYLCWDWKRLQGVTADPKAYKTAGSPLHRYEAPAAAGFGWHPDDLNSAAPSTLQLHGPGVAVKIRYIDLESKY